MVDTTGTGEHSAADAVLAAIANLLHEIPAWNAPAHERVAWYFRKADQLRDIAAGGGPGAELAATLARNADALGSEVARKAVIR